MIATAARPSSLGATPGAVRCATRHQKTGTVSYWDPHLQDWVHHRRSIPDHALAVLPEAMQHSVTSFLLEHGALP